MEKPIISDVNKIKRVDFSQDSLSKPTEFRERVIWSDETTVRSNPKSQDIFVKVHNCVNREDMSKSGYLGYVLGLLIQTRNGPISCD